MLPVIRAAAFWSESREPAEVIELGAGAEMAGQVLAATQVAQVGETA